MVVLLKDIKEHLVKKQPQASQKLEFDKNNRGLPDLPFLLRPKPKPDN